MTMRLTLGPIIPATVITLCIRDQFQRLFQRLADGRIVGHPIRLPQHERRQPMVVKIPLGVGDIQQARRLGILDDVFQCPIDVIAIFSPPRHVPSRQKGERPQTDQPQIVRFPIPRCPLGFRQPGQPPFKSHFSLRRHFPFVLPPGLARTERNRQRSEQNRQNQNSA